MTASSTPTSLGADTGPAPGVPGVPVVPGVRYAPVIRPGRLPAIDDLDPGRRGRRRPSATARRPGSPPPRPRWPTGCGSAPPSATGAASEVLAATAMLAQDRAWLGAAEKRIKEGMPAVRATAAAVDQFVDLFTQIGGLMAERVTDLRDIRDRVVAELSGLPEPGVPVPAAAVHPVRRGPRPRRHRRAGPDARRRPGHHARRADQPHRDHRPSAGHPVRGRGRTGWTTSPAGTDVLIDGTRGTVTVSPDPAEATAAVDAAEAAAAAMAGWTGPGRHRRRPSGVDPGQRPGRLRRPRGAGDSGRGHRAVPHRTVLPQPRHRADRRRAGRDLQRGARRLRRAQGRHPHAGRRVGQAAEVRRASRRGQPRARRARNPDRRRTPRGARAPARRDRARRRAAPATHRG